MEVYAIWALLIALFGFSHMLGYWPHGVAIAQTDPTTATVPDASGGAPLNTQDIIRRLVFLFGVLAAGFLVSSLFSSNSNVPFEAWLGPYHPQTLRLMTQVGVAFWQAREPEHARPLLERAARDIGRFLGRDHELRLQVIATLSDLFVEQRDFVQAKAVQSELLKCRIQRLGDEHPETVATRANLATILLRSVTCDSKREV